MHGMAHGQLLGNWSEQGIPISQQMTVHHSMHREPVCRLEEGGRKSIYIFFFSLSTYYYTLLQDFNYDL